MPNPFDWKTKISLQLSQLSVVSQSHEMSKLKNYLAKLKTPSQRKYDPHSFCIDEIVSFFCRWLAVSFFLYINRSTFSARQFFMLSTCLGCFTFMACCQCVCLSIHPSFVRSLSGRTPHGCLFVRGPLDEHRRPLWWYLFESMSNQ